MQKPDSATARRRNKRAGFRDLVLDHYGRACACCGTTGNLTIDHVNGNGSEHVRRITGDLYQWLAHNGFPAGFQALCGPCNSSKGEGRRCRLDHRPAAATIIGYARVSTWDQHPEAQAARLREYGCTAIYADEGVSGALAARPQWDRCLDHLRRGDTLVTVRLDRIGRSLANLIAVVQQLAERGVDLVVLDQQIDTTTASGRLLFHVVGAIAEFERELLVERVRDGVTAAKVRHGGKLPVRGPSIDPGKLDVARELFARGDLPAKRIAEIVGISRASLYRALPPGGRRTMAP